MASAGALHEPIIYGVRGAKPPDADGGFVSETLIFDAPVIASI